MGRIYSQLGAALLSGSVLPFVFGFLWRRLKRDLKAEAEARKLHAEADGFIADRLYAEIERLDRDLGELRSELATVRRAAESEKNHLEKENKGLRLEVSSLRRRVAQLEEIIKTRTTPEDMRAQLARIDSTPAPKP